MTPEQFYDLKTENREAWYYAGHAFHSLFGIAEYELEEERARDDGDRALLFERKLYRNVDGERSVEYQAATFQGRPFAIVATAGRGQQDAEECVVTDAETYALAVTHLETYRKRPSPTIVATGAELPMLEGMYNHAIVPVGSQMRLVPVDHLAEGSDDLIFDEVEFRKCFDAIVRPAIKSSGPEFEMGLKSFRQRELVVKALAASTIEGMRVSTDFDGEEASKLCYGRQVLLLVADESRTYAIGCHGGGYGFSWVSDIDPFPIGDASLFDRLSNESVPTGPKF